VLLAAAIQLGIQVVPGSQDFQGARVYLIDGGTSAGLIVVRGRPEAFKAELMPEQGHGFVELFGQSHDIAGFQVSLGLVERFGV
jgi:hypothetical protein